MALSDDDRWKLEQVLEACKEPEAIDLLSDWEVGFISSTQERYEQYGDNTRFSEKQWNAVERIWDKIGPR